MDERLKRVKSVLTDLRSVPQKRDSRSASLEAKTREKKDRLAGARLEGRRELGR
jgi:hypothetical protein